MQLADSRFNPSQPLKDQHITHFSFALRDYISKRRNAGKIKYFDMDREQMPRKIICCSFSKWGIENKNKMCGLIHCTKEIS